PARRELPFFAFFFQAEDGIRDFHVTGVQTCALPISGIVHDICSAVHPLALASPFFRELDLGARGVDLAVPEVAYAHPLDGGRAGLAHTSLDRTAEGLGADGAAWHDLIAPLVEDWQPLVALALGERDRK